ncbi:dnaJ homolog subfamily C member 17-like [Impatiens glandulifera]|uniref:dnaJ homolog subfamily C member 17-like n=1 Tax=Impatiens glandulifera TaxID=253017 RepID=UPI001FB18650|nr:dnaJ homolog subfamily C member 17-like [Impatiens glandulifera]
MGDELDHYSILGLSSGEEGAKYSDIEIKKAYRKKALELHPDKRQDDKQAHADIQQLNASYAILKDEKARKLFDDLLRVKQKKILRQSQSQSQSHRDIVRDPKRQKMMSDLEEREQAAFANDHVAKAREEEEIIARKLKEEIARIRAMHTKAVPSTTSNMKGQEKVGGMKNKEKMLKVSWKKFGEDYTAQRLRELFEKFGKVEAVIKSSKKRGSALVVMVSKESAFAATGSVSGSLSNPLLVQPLHPVAASTFQVPQEKFEREEANSSSFVGAGYQAFEDSILKKLEKVLSVQHYQGSVCPSFS